MKASLVAVQISAESSQCFGEGSGSFSQTTNPTTWDGKSCSGRDELRLRLFRFTSGLVAELISSGRVHGSSIQLVFPALPSPLLSPGGGRADMLWSASSGSCYAWQEVQPREAQGPRFWQGEQEQEGGKRG